MLWHLFKEWNSISMRLSVVCRLSSKKYRNVEIYTEFFTFEVQIMQVATPAHISMAICIQLRPFKLLHQHQPLCALWCSHTFNMWNCLIIQLYSFHTYIANLNQYTLFTTVEKRKPTEHKTFNIFWERKAQDVLNEIERTDRMMLIRGQAGPGSNLQTETQIGSFLHFQTHPSCQYAKPGMVNTSTAFLLLTWVFHASC